MMRVTLTLLFGSALLLEAQTAAPMTEAAAKIAARISSLLPRHTTVSLEIQNLSPLPPAELSSFRKSLQDDLLKTGLETAGTPPDSRIRVTLSESSRGVLLVAEIFTGDTRQIAMLPWTLPPASQPKPKLNISKKLLRAQADPILDVLLTSDTDSQMLILSPDQLVSYRMMDGKWVPAATASLVLPHPMPRDPRGRLEAAAGGFRLYLPVATCAGSLQPQLRVSCSSGTQTWAGAPVRWVANRNLLESDLAKAPFYTTGAGFFTPVSAVAAWGSDIAEVANPCGTGPAVIASGASNDRDEVRAYEIVNGQAIPASEAMPLSGSVTALWPAELGQEATLVVRNSQTGDYEAFRLGLSCAQ